MNAMTGMTTIDNRVAIVKFDSNEPIVVKKKQMYATQYMDISNGKRLKNICEAFIDAGYNAIVKKNTDGYKKLVNDYFYVYVEEKLYLRVNQTNNKKINQII